MKWAVVRHRVSPRTVNQEENNYHKVLVTGEASVPAFRHRIACPHRPLDTFRQYDDYTGLGQPCDVAFMYEDHMRNWPVPLFLVTMNCKFRLGSTGLRFYTVGKSFFYCGASWWVSYGTTPCSVDRNG